MVVPVRTRGGFVDLCERTVADVSSYLATRVGDRAPVAGRVGGWCSPLAASEAVDVAWWIAVARHNSSIIGEPRHAMTASRPRPTPRNVDGARLVIGAAYFPDASPWDRAALDEMLASIQIG